MELDGARDVLTAQGLGLCSISYDSVEILRVFADRRGITFPLLADPDSAIIRRFGLLDETAEPGSRDVGRAHPGLFLVDAGGVVRERFFEERFYHRMTMPTVLWRMGAADAVEGDALPGQHVEIRPGATLAAAHPGNRFTLIVDLIPREGVHLYGPSVGGAYQGLSVEIEPQATLTVHPVTYPEAGPLALPWTAESLTGYTGPVRVEVDVALGTRQEMAPLLEAGAGMTIAGTVRLQACDERRCWAPEEARVRWHVDLITPDVERAPDAVQHRPKA